MSACMSRLISSSTFHDRDPAASEAYRITCAVATRLAVSNSAVRFGDQVAHAEFVAGEQADQSQPLWSCAV